MQNLSEEIQNRREWLQEQITNIERHLRRRIKGKLLRAGWYDEEDILASVRRRLDVQVFKGVLSINNEAQLNRLIFKMAERVAIDKYRKMRRQRRLGRIVAVSVGHVIDAPSLTNDSHTRIMSCLCEEDRKLLSLWMNDLSQKEIAQHLGISVEAYRTRRKRLIARLRSNLHEIEGGHPATSGGGMEFVRKYGEAKQPLLARW